MKIIDALKIKKGRFEIPNATRGDFPTFFKEMGYKVGAEIGVYKGEYTSQLASTGLKIFGIDPWLAYDDYDKSGKFQDRLNFLYNLAKDNTAGLDIKLIRKTSMKAVRDFEDESLDFVYIDSNHNIKYVIEDIFEWSKKVKKGGVISGHDYGIPINKEPKTGPYSIHVKYAVDAYTQSMGIKNWYILGTKEKIEGVRRDIWRSWFWIK